MTYRLEFLEQALKEWRKLSLHSESVQEVVRTPTDQSAFLLPAYPAPTCRTPIELNCAMQDIAWSTKHDDVVTVIVLSVSKRDKNKVYNLAQLRKSK
jgi:mRNA interferase RelE/StbE